MFDELVAKVNNSDTSALILKTKYDTDKSDLEKKIRSVNKKIPLTRGIVKKTDCSAKISEIKIKIPSASVLATNFVLNAVENKLVI